VHTCDVCSAKVHELRRGRCWGCYSRWVDARPVGYNARCLTCGERRRRLLKSVELFGGWPAMCFSCAGQLMMLDPMPATVQELKVAVSRERRKTDRRIGKPDTRVFQFERRIGQRRLMRPDGTDYAAIDDDMIVEIVVEAEPVADEPIDFDDMTRIFAPV
jgi:hypothetical protein